MHLCKSIPVAVRGFCGGFSQSLARNTGALGITFKLQVVTAGGLSIRTVIGVVCRVDRDPLPQCPLSTGFLLAGCVEMLSVFSRRSLVFPEGLTPLGCC